MLQAFEVIVEPDGLIHSLEELHVQAPTRAILTLLEKPLPLETERGSGAAVLALLQTPRYANRPMVNSKDIEHRIQNLRNDWEDD